MYLLEREGLSNFKKPGFWFSVIYPKKSGLSKKLKVSTLDIRIKNLGLKVSHSKVPSSDEMKSINKIHSELMKPKMKEEEHTAAVKYIKNIIF